jgi:hypothetical protein
LRVGVNRTINGVLAWGLLFLLDLAQARASLRRCGAPSTPEGASLHGTPGALGMADGMTGCSSQSLGEHAYRRLTFCRDLKGPIVFTAGLGED